MFTQPAGLDSAVDSNSGDTLMETKEKLEQEVFYTSPGRRRMKMFTDVFAHLLFIITKISVMGEMTF